MHQTSSRLLRMTDDERPYTRPCHVYLSTSHVFLSHHSIYQTLMLDSALAVSSTTSIMSCSPITSLSEITSFVGAKHEWDFKDLFATLIVSLPLTAHRVRFQKVDHTFTSEEAITNLGSLKFSQSNRMPDPKDPSRIVTTTTTTTFSMAKEMARSVCQKFLDARFIESVDGKIDFTSKSAVWQLTPKGMHILHRFCLRNGIAQDHVKSIIESPRNCMKLVILERDVESDRLSHDAATVEVIFRRFAGPAPNVKTEAAVSDSDSIHEYATGLVGVKMLNDRKVGDRFYKLSFTGKAATDWLMDCCTMVDKRETYEVASLFVEFGLIRAVEGFGNTTRFQASKGAIYYVTERGQVVAGWLSGPTGSLNGDSASKLTTPGNMVGRDSNANRMQVIVKDPALRLLFREYLRHTHCEENLSFYLDVSEFLTNYRTSKKSTNTPKLEFIRETLASAYSLYNAFLAPGSPCELNIDHSLRIALASRMTRAVGDDDAMIRSLDEVANLFDQAQTTVFKLMATDSVPKFSRDPKYVNVLKERNLDFGNSSQ
ncbi:RGS-domain-containing protein [Pseudovirgaria hyperparasitica]|uniref:RGS-domain-containing protein n=1 Tax=Pseudovirgaria hyperparasitica TaxID=470096 RepID=A0A6A6WC21_9PEZI|nr:RGS-domain-containing protein [Pseudovirgaria hyperparasitica]KAF2759719.1 RGS-domain-containing protein [Pseudovirgaria hyperparasitica]